MNRLVVSYHCHRPNKCFLPNSFGQIAHAVLRRCHSFQRGTSLRSFRYGYAKFGNLICTAAATHPKSYSTTGRGCYKPFAIATCVCLPTRPSSAPSLPIFFFAGSGMLVLSTPDPNTVGQLRSFIGAYKVFSHVIRRCSSYLSPLDAVTTRRPSQDFSNWTDDLLAAFRSAQNPLLSAHTITVQRPEDQLWCHPLPDARRLACPQTLYFLFKVH